MRKIKVLFFYPDEFYGPPLSVFVQIAQHLDRDRFQAYVVINRDADGTLAIADGDGIVVRRLPFGRTLRHTPVAAARSSVSVLASLLDLAQFARREGIDIVQCAEAARTSALGLSVARLAGARLLVHYHNLVAHYDAARRAMMYAACRQADHAVAVSQFVASQILASVGSAPGRLDVIVNGANLTRFHPAVDGSSIRRAYGIAADAPLVVQVGRLYPSKRQEDLVRAFAIARRDVPELRGLIVGWESPGRQGSYGSYKDYLRALSREAGLGDSLILAEPRGDVPEIMAAADMVAMPSLNEPWGLVVTEAMAAGKPVIGADSGGIPEMVDDGRTGFLVPPRSPQALAERVVRLARDADLRRAMGSAARTRCEALFDERRLAAEFSPIYERLAAEEASAAPATSRVMSTIRRT